MRNQVIALAIALVLAPPSARAADLVVWWHEGFYPQEDEAVREVIAAFEQKTGKEVELVLQPQEDLRDNLVGAVEAGRPPDFVFSSLIQSHHTEWAFEDRLVDLTDAIGPFSDLFDPDLLAWVMLLNGRTGQRALYGLPIGRATNHLHVWKTLLKQAGFTLEDIPKEWDAFWSFWCDQVQSGVRRATGRDTIWGIGLAFGVGGDTLTQFFQFVSAYEADYVTHDGRLVIDDPEIRQRLIKAIDGYTAIHRRGCTPPDAATWAKGIDNNERFHAQAIVMTLNDTLSVPNALKRERSNDYYENTATIEWPLGPRGKPFPIHGYVQPAMVFKEGSHAATAKEFVRFLMADGWLAHYLNFSGERFLPAMSALSNQPFWLDPGDPHRMAAAMQVSSRPMHYDYAGVTGDWRHDEVWQERVWAKAVHRTIAEGISPEQAVDEAIARTKEILNK
jgi:multiple sugar transport system substrate-binding protein